jgi:hypothetical protein
VLLLAIGSSVVLKAQYLKAEEYMDMPEALKRNAMTISATKACVVTLSIGRYALV